MDFSKAQADNSIDTKDDNDKTLDVRVSQVHLINKSQEYDVLENELAKLENEAMTQEQKKKADQRTFKHQMKQTIKHKGDESTDTDEYKDLHSTSSTSGTDIKFYAQTRKIQPKNKLWWKRPETIFAGIVIVGIVSYIMYKHILTKPSNTSQSRMKILRK